MAVRAFHHDAMKTTFSIRLTDANTREAAGIARDCFEYLDYLEGKLSRYLEGSDIWQINHLKAGESLFLSEPCYQCLNLATQAHQETAGLFDISLGTQIEAIKLAQASPPPTLVGKLVIDPERPLIHCEEAGREIDLGGIGKGFALEQMKSRMLDWGIESGLLSAGPSSQLAYGSQAWQIDLNGDRDSTTIELRNSALSASGTGIQGSHIVSPLGQTPAYAFKRIWITHTNAALADAWSTAIMLLDEDQLAQLQPEESSVYVESRDGDIVRIY